MSSLVHQAVALVINHETHNKPCDDLLESVLAIPEGRDLYKDSIVEDMLGEYWQGESLNDCSIQLIADQGMGDIIQMLRYMKQLKETWDCKVYLNCVAWYSQLKRVVERLDFIDEFSNHPRKSDYWTNMFCVPFVLNQLDKPHYPPQFARLLETKIPPAPLLKPLNVKEFLSPYKIGVAWHSHKSNPLSEMKSRSIDYFISMKRPGQGFYSLLPTIDPQVYNSKIDDLQDTIDIIAGMDEVWSVDTAVLHVAGSMQKKTLGFLYKYHDPRWNKNVWYDNMNFIYFD